MKKFTVFVLTLLVSFGFIMTLTSFSIFENDAVKNRDNTPGTITFTVRTVSTGGTYSPKHVLAIWVEHNGTFVKTRKAMANQRKQYLYTWKAVSNYNVIDAITGSTLSNHQTHTVQWDCTDLDGNIVPDGTYKIRIEFTDKHAQGPLFEIEFNKGTEAISLSPPDEQYFKDIEFSYEPDVVLLADFSSDVQQTCMNETVVFTDNSTGATTWAWNFGEGANPATANTQGPHSVTYSSAGSKTVSLTIDQGITQTKTDYITVSPDATAGYTWTQQGLAVTFTNTSQNANVYTWDFGDGNTGSTQNPVHTYSAPGTYTVSLTAISDMCADDEFIDQVEVVLTADFSSDVQQTCMNETVVFTDNSTGATSWAWNFGEGANPATANTQGPHSVAYSSAGSKTVSLTIDQGITQTKTDYITVSPDAMAGFTWTQQSRTIDFTNTSQNAASYLWDFGDGNTGIEENPVHTYAEDGSYNVSLTAVSELCADDQFTEEIVINTVGMDEPVPMNPIRVSPNPGNGIFYLSPAIDLTNSEIRIFDVQGKMVFGQKVEIILSGSSFTFGNNQLNAGIYYLQLKSKQGIWQQKLLVNQAN